MWTPALPGGLMLWALCSGPDGPGREDLIEDFRVLSKTSSHIGAAVSC